jgi:hypothetical protein
MTPCSHKVAWLDEVGEGGVRWLTGTVKTETRINDDDHNCMEAKDWQDGVQNRFDHGK